MAQTSKETETKKPHKGKDRATEIANTFEWLITAFILAFVFRAFVMEAFRIPTGSMADTLKGAHWRLRCSQCGYKYDRGFMPGRMNPPLAQDTVPSFEIALKPTKCPSCGLLLNNGHYNPSVLVDNGDRILVLKCLYQIFEPKRWDVIVFKNPDNPRENYIKRLIALPEEKIEIVDGDVYIDDKIVRKPPKVQQEHWMPIYCNDYQPIKSDANRFGYQGQTWTNPYSSTSSKWVIHPNDLTRLHLECPISQQELESVRYNTPNRDTFTGNDFRACYAYNNATDLRDKGAPDCSDLMVEFYATLHEPGGKVGALLSKYGTGYRGWIDTSNGQMVLDKETADGRETLITQEITSSFTGKPVKLRFQNVDHLLTLTYGDTTLSHDLGDSTDSLVRNTEKSPEVELLGMGKITLGHINIYRDIHYLDGSRKSKHDCRGAEGNPFQLNADEFFVMGDNSPNSHDARWWRDPITSSKGQRPPRTGIVPRDYLVGKAMFVYWPGGFRFPWPKRVQSFAAQNNSGKGIMRILRGIINLRWVPNIGDMRFIYGGTSRNMAQQSPPNAKEYSRSDS